jgi:hypothetical protein
MAAIPARKSRARPLPPVAEAAYGPYAAIILAVSPDTLTLRSDSLINGRHVDRVIGNTDESREDHRCNPVDVGWSEGCPSESEKTDRLKGSSWYVSQRYLQTDR